MAQYLKVGILSMDTKDNYPLHRVALYACRINLHACRINLHAYGDTLHACVVGKRHHESNTKKIPCHQSDKGLHYQLCYNLLPITWRKPRCGSRG